MKKLALFLALIMVVAACVIPVSAADETRTISFEAHNGDSAYLVADASTTTWRPDLGGSNDEYYALKKGEQIVYKFFFDEPAASAKISIPALGVYTVYAGSTLSGVQEVFSSAQLSSFNDAYCGGTDNWSTPNLDPSEYTTVFEPFLGEIDLTGMFEGSTIYVVLKCTDDIPNGVYTGIWAKDSAISNSRKYVNRRWNLSHGFPKDGGVEGSRGKNDAVDGEKYSDGMITLTYTPASTNPPIPFFNEFVKILDFDEAYFGTLDTEGHIDGTGCCSFTFKETSGTEIFSKKFDAVDLILCDYVEFWFYISDASKLDQFTGAQIELSSSGTCDEEESTWNLPASWNSIIVGEAKDGWNLIRLDLHKSGDNYAIKNNINWFRLYTLEGSKLAGVTIKFDDMYAYSYGTTVPAPVKEIKEPEIEIEGGNAVVPEEAVEIKEGEDIVIDVSGTEEEVTSVELGSELFSKIAEAAAKDNTAAVIALPDASLEIDADALAAISEQADGKPVSLSAQIVEEETLNDEQKDALKDKEVLACISLEMFAGETQITDFRNGTVTVAIPFELPEETDGEDFYVAYVADDGTVTPIKTEYVDGKLVFSTGHFSSYVVLKAEAATTQPEDDPTPATFDAAASIAVVAVAAMGIVLVSSKKRH